MMTSWSAAMAGFRDERRDGQIVRKRASGPTSGNICAMKLLAFDTSTQWLSVGCGEDTNWSEHSELAGQAHSSRLLPRIEAALAQAGWTLADLDAIAFGAGPGSFTGVRIACGVAQGLSLGADVPLVPIPTLEAIAQAAWRAHGATQVQACLDARMREIYVAAYRREGMRWETITEPAVMPPDALRVPEPRAWFGAGDGFAVYPKLATQPGMAGCDAMILPNARAIAELALPRLAAGEAVDAAHALPLYVRHRVALTTAERAAGARL